MPIGIPWLAAVALALLDGRRAWVGWTAVAAMGASLGTLVAVAATVLADGPVRETAGGWAPGVGIVLRADALGIAFALVSGGVLLVSLLHEVLGDVDARTFPAVVLFMATGLNGLFLTGDLFNFYVFFELAMMSAYVLTAYGPAARQSGAALIFAVVNLLGSFVFLLAVAGAYSVTGTLEMSTMGARLGEEIPNTVILISVSMFVAFGVKLGLFPFHFWLPAVYTTARPAVAAILSGALANIGSYGLIRFGGELLPAGRGLGAGALLVLGTTSIVYGAVQAISRRGAEEVLAYSAIGQVGYVLIALGVGGPVGYAAAIVYALVNALNKALLFLASGLRGWMVGAAFAVGAFSVTGIPPSAGFFAKLEMFRVGAASGSVALTGLIFLGGALSFLYMLQIYQHDFWRGEQGTVRSPAGMRALVVGLAVLVVAVGVWPEPMLALSRDAAAALPGSSP